MNEKIYIYKYKNIKWNIIIPLLLFKGLKLWLRCDAKTGYCNQFSVYLGKNTETGPNGLIFDVIDDLTKPIRHKNHRVFFRQLLYFISYIEVLAQQRWTNNLLQCILLFLRLYTYNFANNIKYYLLFLNRNICLWYFADHTEIHSKWYKESSSPTFTGGSYYSSRWEPQYFDNMCMARY